MLQDQLKANIENVNSSSLLQLLVSIGAEVIVLLGNNMTEKEQCSIYNTTTFWLLLILFAAYMLLLIMFTADVQKWVLNIFSYREWKIHQEDYS